MWDVLMFDCIFLKYSLYNVSFIDVALAMC